MDPRSPRPAARHDAFVGERPADVARAERVHARPREPGILAVVEDEALASAAPRTCGMRAAKSDNPPIFDDFFNPDLALRVPFRRKRFTMQVRARMVVSDAVAVLDGPIW